MDFPDSPSIERPHDPKPRTRLRRERVAVLRAPADPLPLSRPVARSGARRRSPSEARVLRWLLAAAGCLIIAGALLGSAGSVLLALFACLACATRIEQKYRKGDYGSIADETIE
jgi:hypothetical protein